MVGGPKAVAARPECVTRLYAAPVRPKGIERHCARGVRRHIVRLVTHWRIALGSVLLALVVAAGCSDDEEPAGPATTDETEATDATTTSSTAPERPASTTTTALDPATVEGQVEAAYLKSWDVYADAVYNLDLDEDALAEVYTEESLSNKVDEIRRRISDGRAGHARIDHNYEVVVVDDTTAHVVDRFINHQVLIDPASKQPVEADPNEELLFNFKMKKTDGAWKVALIQRINE